MASVSSGGDQSGFGTPQALWFSVSASGATLARSVPVDPNWDGGPVTWNRVASDVSGRSVTERLQGTMPDEGVSTLVPWLEADEKLDQFLKLRLTDWSSLAGGLGTLVPLFLGWISSSIK